MKKGSKKNIILGVMLSLVLLLELPMATIHADTTVYTTATGSKYHFSSSCRGLSNAKNIYTSTLSEAKAKGLTACSICATGSADDSESSSSKKTSSDENNSSKEASSKNNNSSKEAEKNETVSLTSQKKTASVHVGDIVILKINNKKKVTWAASNKNVKFLKKSKKQSKLKMLKAGKTKITAKVNGKSYTWKLTIK
ncbi:hypothetical protein SAMN04487770_12173 [Butyrivibrio sp. ob235]|uniref:hypothetical protein n=1 Tax=Butyrivibrio sp. ob235 TaxID=1761780 RepID=UPI0008D5A33E|nr:hypothetical protein [Butyrivibrio sp. ob235]SEL94832.1 hypothetical protein SAMN04487770_12173 [Butyrivibrio sp. ob235]